MKMKIVKKHILCIFIVLSHKTFAYEYKNFVVIVPSYNNKNWYRINLDSIFSQNYPKEHYRVIYINDNSNDNTLSCVKKYIQKQHLTNIRILSKEIQEGPLKSRYDAVYQCLDNEIIVNLDGDDWFAHPNVLQRLNQAYQDPNVWMTYGQFIRWCEHCSGTIYPTNIQKTSKCKHGYLGHCFPIDYKELKKRKGFKHYLQHIMRTKGGWVFGPTRTFYAALFKQIKRDHLTDKKGNFYCFATDLATTLPMAEMALYHIKYIPDITYVYNRSNPLNLSKITKNKLKTGYNMNHKGKYHYYPPLKQLPG